MDDLEKKRREQLALTWQLMADAVLRSLKTDNPTASMLEAARKFLADNGCTSETLQRWRGVAGLGPFTLPTFPDDDDSDQSNDGASDNTALISVPPFTAEE